MNRESMPSAEGYSIPQPTSPSLATTRDNQHKDPSTLRRGAASLFHHVPPIHGRTRLVRLIHRALEHLAQRRSETTRSGVFFTEMRLGYRMLVDVRTETEFLAYYTGDYDSSRIRGYCRLFGRGWHVADVGAHIGFYSVPFAQRLGCLAGRVHCFEPVPANVQRLRQNIELNGVAESCAVYEVALSDHSGEKTLALREDFLKGGTTGNASVLIDDGLDENFPNIVVRSVRLDDYVQAGQLTRIDFIKADIEGHEYLFLEGAHQTIRHCRPVVCVELKDRKSVV